MIRRIRARADFRRLSREGTRFRTSALWCTWCPDPELTTTHVAFAIGRATGTAVQRNRRRRQIRSILDEMGPELPAGLMIIGVRNTISELTYDQLRTEVTALIRSCSAASSA